MGLGYSGISWHNYASNAGYTRVTVSGYVVAVQLHFHVSSTINAWETLCDLAPMAGVLTHILPVGEVMTAAIKTNLSDLSMVYFHGGAWDVNTIYSLSTGDYTAYACIPIEYNYY